MLFFNYLDDLKYDVQGRLFYFLGKSLLSFKGNFEELVK